MLILGFTDRDRGWKEFCTQFKLNSGETAGLVGYLRGEEHKPKSGTSEPKEPMTMAKLAAIHEYGGVGHHGNVSFTIPERSFIRSAMDENAKAFKKLLTKLTKQVVDGHSTKKKAIGVLCEVAKGYIQNKISSNVPPPLADSTVKAKGSSKTLIDTGQLRDGVEWEIREGGDK